MNDIVKGDKYTITWKVSGDLTGATVRLVARQGTEDPVILAATVTDAAAGEGTHTLTGDLDVGYYDLELEAVTGEEKITYKMGEQLRVIASLD